MESIKKIIDSENYSLLLKKVQMKVPFKLNEAAVPVALLNYDLGRLKTAKISTNDLSSLFDTNMESIVNYAIQKMKYSFDEEEEFPKGEELGDDETPKTIKTLPYYKDFLITALIEYYLLKNNPTELSKYLKGTRTPNAKKYEKELKEIYSNL